MKYFLFSFFVVALFAFVNVPSASASANANCANGTLTYSEFQSAKGRGLISGKITIDETNHQVKADVVNKTGCNLPVSFGVFKMFDQKLFNQEVFDETKNSSSDQNVTLTDKLPDCMAQIDLWYGDINLTIGAKHPPVDYGQYLIAYKFYKNLGSGYADARGDFCGSTPPPPPTQNSICLPVKNLGQVVANYPTGPHAIVGEPELHLGLDIVVKLNEKGDFLQCFSGTSPSAGQHVVYSYWRNVGTSTTCNSGEILVPNANPGWGDYLTPNSNYCVKNIVLPHAV